MLFCLPKLNSTVHLTKKEQSFLSQCYPCSRESNEVSSWDVVMKLRASSQVKCVLSIITAITSSQAPAWQLLSLVYKPQLHKLTGKQNQQGCRDSESKKNKFLVLQPKLSCKTGRLTFARPLFGIFCWDKMSSNIQGETFLPPLSYITF